MIPPPKETTRSDILNKNPKMLEISNPKNYWRGCFQVLHQEPSQNQWRSGLWVYKWNDSINICKCCHPSDNNIRRQTWSHFPNHELRSVRNVNNGNTMGRLEGPWLKFNHSRKFHSCSWPTGQQNIRRRTPDFWRRRNNGQGPQALSNWNYWRHLHHKNP